MPGFVVPAIGSDAVGGRNNEPAAQARAEFYYTYTWRVFDLFEEAAFGVGSTDTPLIYLRDATLPTFTANTDSYVSGSLEYKWAKSVRWEDIKISWYDTKGLLEVMRRWRARVWTPLDGLQTAGVYKRRSQLDSHLPTWNEDDIQSWRLINSWPKIIKHGDLTYTNSDAKVVEVTIAYDWAEEIPSNLV